MKARKNISDLPHMDDEALEKFWSQNEPEDFEGWHEVSVKFARPPKKLIQLRLDPRDARLIDKESQRSGIDRAQLVRSWVKEKINLIQSQGK